MKDSSNCERRKVSEAYQVNNTTFYMQITTQAAFHFAMKELDKDTNARRAELDAIMKVIIDTKVRMYHVLECIMFSFKLG